MKTVQHCPNCNSQSFKSKKKYKSTFLVKCNSCHLVFTEKHIPDEELEIYYNKEYHRNNVLSPITVKRYHELLDFFESYRKTNRILDIGCGCGFFLEIAKQRGWEVYGTEFTQNAIEICEEKGITMKKGSTSSSMFDAEYFDVVTSFEVIEHHQHQQTEMKAIKHFLRKGGLFYCTTPNFNAFERRILKSNYKIIKIPAHLTYFTKKSFHHLLSKNHFKKVFLHTHGISLSNLSNDQCAEQNIGKVSESSKDEKLRTKLEQSKLNRMIKKFTNHLLSTTGLGNSLKGAYEKK